MAFRVQIRRGTASEWTASNPILLDGELAIEKDTRKFKIGDGVTNWNELLYATQLHNHDGIYNTKAEIANLLNKKVDKITGKSLSANDYTDAEKLKNQENADNINSLQGVRIHKGATAPTDTSFWYDPNDKTGVIRK